MERDAASGAFRPVEVPGSVRLLEADMVLLAMGFLGPEERLAKELGVSTDERSNYKVGARGLGEGGRGWAGGAHPCRFDEIAHGGKVAAGVGRARPEFANICPSPICFSAHAHTRTHARAHTTT